jgi:hypothetical protein
MGILRYVSLVEALPQAIGGPASKRPWLFLLSTEARFSATLAAVRSLSFRCSSLLFVVSQINALDSSRIFSVCPAGERSGQRDYSGKSWARASALGDEFFLSSSGSGRM